MIDRAAAAAAAAAVSWSNIITIFADRCDAGQHFVVLGAGSQMGYAKKEKRKDGKNNNNNKKNKQKRMLSCFTLPHPPLWGWKFLC